MRFLSLLLCFSGLLLAGIPVQAQTDLDRSRFNTAAYYNYAEIGDITILVNVWGAVRFPGLYEVPDTTRLSEVLSLAGGPAITQRRKQDRRTVTLELARTNPINRTSETILRQQMENQIVAPENDIQLVSGDVLTVEVLVRERFTWRDFIPIVAAIGTLALAVERFSSGSN